MRVSPGIGLSIAALLILTVYAGASDRPRAILVFEQSDVRAPFYAAIFSGLRAKVNSAQTRPVTLYVENLDLGRFHGAGYEQSLSERFAIKYQDSPIGVILTVGSAALDHAIRWRPVLWPGVPIVLAFVDEKSSADVDLPTDVTGRLARLRQADTVTAAEEVDGEVRNRVPSLWQDYGWELAAITVALVLQTVLIIALLYEHGWRRIAEFEASQRMAELAHMNRCATAGELSSTMAHELNQPLGAIQCNAAAGQRLLATGSPDLEEVGLILRDIKRDTVRASSVIEHMHRLLSKMPSETRDVNLDEVIREVFEFMSPQALAAGARLDRVPTRGTLVVRGDPVQLQQVVLNLVLNALDSVCSRPLGERRIAGLTHPSGTSLVEVAISDSGPGVQEDRLANIFEPFVTTKSKGLGMGLPIARSIVEAHGGQIWAEKRDSGGAVFRFKLPRATARRQ